MVVILGAIQVRSSGKEDRAPLRSMYVSSILLVKQPKAVAGPSFFFFWGGVVTWLGVTRVKNVPPID